MTSVANAPWQLLTHPAGGLARIHQGCHCRHHQYNHQHRRHQHRRHQHHYHHRHMLLLLGWQLSLKDAVTSALLAQNFLATGSGRDQADGGVISALMPPSARSLPGSLTQSSKDKPGANLIIVYVHRSSLGIEAEPSTKLDCY